jgi:hypothetical protein
LKSLGIRRIDKKISLKMIDTRAARLAELKAQLQALSKEGRATAPGSPRREAVLARWAPIHAAVLALADELSRE